MTDAKKILIVEDEKPMAQALETKLNRAGFNARAVFNGSEALSTLEIDIFDLIILDLIMPQTDGFTVLEKLKEKGNKTPVIVASNLRQEEDFSRAKSLGAVDFIVKSRSSLSQIVLLITEFFNKK
ncbi:MAG: response regulator [Patescibacteria group bacterium]